MIATLEAFFQAIINAILLAGIYGILAAGLSLCFGVTRVADSAHAAFAILGSHMVYWLFILYGIDPILSMAISVPILFVIGFLVQKFTVSRMIGRGGLEAFTLTFFLATLLENGQIVAWGNEYRAIVSQYGSTSISIGGLYFPLGRLIAFIACIIVQLALYAFLRFTYVGKAMRAIAQNRDSAKLCGVPVELIYMLAFGLSLALASIGGTMIAICYTFYPSIQTIWIGRLYAVVILGGLGSIPGSLVASFILTISDSIIGMFAPVLWGNIVSWLVLLLVLLLKPSGLFGRR